MSHSLVLVARDLYAGPSLLATAQHTLHSTPMAPPAGGGPKGGWAHVPLSGPRPSDARPHQTWQKLPDNTAPGIPGTQKAPPTTIR